MNALVAEIATGLVTIIVTIITVWAGIRRSEKEMAINMAVMDTKLEELTREVREHNNFARRLPVLEEQIKEANHRISDLEEKTNESK